MTFQSYIKSPLLEAHGIPHIFATRHGGVSIGDAFGSLNVSTSRTDKDGKCDNPENVFANYGIALSKMNANPELSVNATQTHSKIILRVTERDAGRGIVPSRGYMPECDGLLLTRETVGIDAVCIKTADCVPIILADTECGAVCAIHAGWRGTVANIAGEAVRMLISVGGSAESIIAAIGPCIGSCCYEVGVEVRNAAESVLLSCGSGDVERFFRKKENGKFMANLGELNRELLLLSGVPFSSIDLLNFCTCCSLSHGTPLFFSHRASGGHSGAHLTSISPPPLHI